MAKRPKLLQAEIAQESGKPQPGDSGEKYKTAPSREGTVLLGVHVKPAVRKQVKAASVEHNTSIHAIVAAALNLWFEQNGYPQIAG